MKYCKKCGNKIPSVAKINEKYQSLTGRTYCLDCSPFGSRNGYKLRKENTRQGKNKKQCPICKKEFPWTKNSVCSTCRSAIQRWTNRNKAYEVMGSKCVKCSNDDCDVLTAHHKDKNTKKFELSRGWHLSWKRIEEEVSKCELLCFNCHTKLHAQENQKQLKIIQEYYANRT
jgi:hypothetical protein